MIICGFLAISCTDSRRTGDIRNERADAQPLPAEAAGEGFAYEEDTWPATFGFGKRASAADVRRWDIDVMPDGRGLPKGKGVPSLGRPIYLAKCASCHGQHGEGDPYDVLISDSKRSIGTYWPYATTLFDYIRRAMPFNMPGSLTDEEVYHLTAYLLAANGVIDSITVLDQKSLPQVVMPAHDRFVMDDRKGGPEVK